MPARTAFFRTHAREPANPSDLGSGAARRNTGACDHFNRRRGRKRNSRSAPLKTARPWGCKCLRRHFPAAWGIRRTAQPRALSPRPFAGASPAAAILPMHGVSRSQALRFYRRLRGCKSCPIEISPGSASGMEEEAGLNPVAPLRRCREFDSRARPQFSFAHECKETSTSAFNRVLAGASPAVGATFGPLM